MTKKKIKYKKIVNVNTEEVGFVSMFITLFLTAIFGIGSCFAKYTDYTANEIVVIFGFVCFSVTFVCMYFLTEKFIG